MTISAQSVIRRAVDTIQDTTNVRWPVNELVRYLNDGQREVALYRPDSTVTNATVTCVAGTKQALPSGGAKLMDVVRNVASTSNKKSVRMVNREILDAQIPGWHGLTPSVNIVHFMYDARDPLNFYVYPPATTSAQVDIVYSAYPTDITEPADGASYDDVTGNLSVPDIYSNVVLDYILYRAYSKDSEYAGNVNRAQAHYAAFANALGVEIRATSAMAPNPVGNPNRQVATAVG